MRSLSNVIKAYTVRYEDAKITIDNHLKKDADILFRRSLMVEKPTIVEGFVEGIQAVVVEPEEATNEKAEKLLASANDEANLLLEQAKKEAEQIKADAFAQGKKLGYEEGMQQAQLEIKDKQMELETQRQNIHRDYEKMQKSLEPSMAILMVNLIERITGVVVEGQKDVILYLIERGFEGLDKVDDITIKVSAEDFDMVAAKQDYLLNSIGRNVDLKVLLDNTLKSNQAKIETENKIIDCSLDVQLENLIKDIKLLGRV